MLHCRPRRRDMLGFGALAVFRVGNSWADQYPSKAVTMVVGSAPGGFTDILGRIISQKLQTQLGQPFVVDNKAGASTTIGTALVARAAPDGYTLLMGHFSGISVAPALYSKLPYDPVKDLTPIARIASTPVILTLHPSVPAKDLKELIDYLRKNPGSISYATSGIGTAQHLAAVQFMQATKTDMVHIPYKGSAAGITDLLGGRVHLNFESPPNVLPMIKSGKLRAIAITSAARSALLPEVPTMQEAGLPGFEMSQWFGVMGPANLPKSIVNILNKEINKALTMTDVEEKINAQGGKLLGGTAEQFAAYQKNDASHWAKLIKVAGIQPE